MREGGGPLGAKSGQDLGGVPDYIILNLDATWDELPLKKKPKLGNAKKKDRLCL